MYRIRLQDFEGPLDLLLFFIRRDEVDIYDIPIAQITDEYLSYVKVMEQIDLDGVGEFIYMAALLISIKARLLLPTQEIDEDGEPIDPRQELVERLLEYMRFKEASEHLTEAHDRRDDLFTRGDASAEEARFAEDAPETLTNTSLYHLINALGRLLVEAPEEPVHEIARVEYSVEEQRTFVLQMIAGQGQQTFASIVQDQRKAFIIATFLAVLELARVGDVWLEMTEAADDFYIVPGQHPGNQSTNGRRDGN